MKLYHLVEIGNYPKYPIMDPLLNLSLDHNEEPFPPYFYQFK